MPSSRLRLAGATWEPWKFQGTSVAGGRNGLIAGVHMPGPGNTGPYTISSWVDVFPSSGNSITLNSPGTYKGRRFWGTVKWSVPGIRFEECHFVGPDPTTFSAITGCIQNFGSNPQIADFYDCLVDPMPWITIQGKAKLNPYYMGIHGGNCRVYRMQLTNVHDGWNWIGPSALPAANTQEHILQQSWFHKGLYFNNVYPPNDGQPHSDAFQTNFGWNLTIRGNLLGGPRDSVGYNRWPTDQVAHPAGDNTGEDFWNSAMILKQEVDDEPTLHHIRDVLIELNWLAGGASTINHAYDPASPNAWGNNVIVRDNRIMRRGADWGKKMRGDGLDLPGYDNSSSPLSGYYIIKNASILSLYSNNVIYEQDGTITTTAAPVTNG